jgi:Zn-dependent protease with chaperone function
MCRCLAEDANQRESLLRFYGKWRTYHSLGLLGVHGLALYVFGWGWTVQQLTGGGPTVVAGADLLILLPFLTGLILSWFFFYDAERALHRLDISGTSPFWRRGAYVAFHVRLNLALIFLPILLLILMRAVRFLGFGAQEPTPLIALLVGIVPALIVFLSLPWVLRLLLGLKPLPDSPLRQQLLATARRLNFRFSNILLWNTRQGVVNAMVVGLFPWPRYVLLTDRLLAEMSSEEVEAVFGHEIGHVKHYHMAFYFGFLSLSLLSLWMIWCLLALNIPFFSRIDAMIQTLVPVFLLGIYIFLVFGFLSRRCERQADIFGCRAVSCQRRQCNGHDADTVLSPKGRGLCPTGILTFIEALEKVARLNGMSRDRPGWLQSWQHSTIACRVAFLQRLLEDPSLARRFQRRVTLVKWSLLLVVGAILALVIGSNWNSFQEPGDLSAHPNRVHPDSPAT